MNSYIMKYKTVSSIPSYLKIDGLSVIDNGDTTYDIFDISSNQINLSDFGVVADFRREGVGITSGSNVITGSGFTQSDISKLINIKQSYHNPDTFGAEFPKTTPGKIVSITATIDSVVDGVSATISFDLEDASNGTINQTRTARTTKRSYVYTNNFEKIKQAINFAYFQSIQNIDNDLIDGQIGWYGLDNKIYDITDVEQLLQSSLNSINLISSGNSFIKLCVEEYYADFVDSNFGARAYVCDVGNNDIKIYWKHLPPDLGSTVWANESGTLLDLESAGNSIRHIYLADQSYGEPDNDRYDSFWNGKILNNSGGGIQTADEDETQYQILDMEFGAVRLKHGGITSFSNAGFISKLIEKNIVYKFNSNYKDEQGRENYPFTYDDKLDWAKWTFGAINVGTFDYASNICTAPAGSDFSFYDFPKTTHEMYLIIGGVQVDLVSIQSAKQATFTAGIADQTGVDITLQDDSGSHNWGHPHYVHPNQSLDLDNVEVWGGIYRFYSSGGKEYSERATMKFNNIRCVGTGNIELNNNTSISNFTAIFTNSIVNAYLFHGNIQIENVSLSGNLSSIKTLKPANNKLNFTGNTYNINGIVTEELNFISIGETIEQFTVDFQAVGVNIHLVNTNFVGRSNLPYFDNGSLLVENSVSKLNASIARMNVTRYGANSKVSFKNVELLNSNFGWFDVGFGDIQYAFEELNFSSAVQQALQPPKINTDSNLGIFSVSSRSTSKLFKVGFANSNPFFIDANEIYYGHINTNESNRFLLKASLRIFNSNFGDNNSNGFKFIGTGNSGWLNGVVEIEIGAGGELDIYKTVASKLRTDAILANFMVKSIHRNVGEIIQFKVDKNQSRFIEIGEPEKHIVGSKPARKGVEGEKVWLNDAEYYEYEIDFVDISANNYNADKTLDVVTKLTMNPAQVFSIFQEKSNGSAWEDFSFTIEKSDTNTISFEFDPDFLNGINYETGSEFTKNYWSFKEIGGTGIRCYINNLSGEIVFDQDLDSVLDPSVPITIDSGYKITRSEWVKKATASRQDTGVTLDMSNPFTVYYNMSDINSGEVYIFTDALLGGKIKSFINTTNIPVITGATLITGSTWETATDMYLIAEYNGSVVEYWFEEI